MLNLTSTPRTIFAALAITAAAGLSALPASAGSAAAISVNVSQSDLMTEVGTQRVYYRLKQTAENACQAGEGMTSIKQRLAADACVAQLMDSFVGQINAQRMTAFHTKASIQKG